MTPAGWVREGSLVRESGDKDFPDWARLVEHHGSLERQQNEADPMPVKLVCLLPARNAAADLPGFFESAARFADAVVALDDGSSDDTGMLLRANPLVARVEVNPHRSDFRGWNDAANRNLLLKAAAGLRPDWIIS